MSFIDASEASLEQTLQLMAQLKGIVSKEKPNLSEEFHSKFEELMCNLESNTFESAAIARAVLKISSIPAVVKSEEMTTLPLLSNGTFLMPERERYDSLASVLERHTVVEDEAKKT